MTQAELTQHKIARYGWIPDLPDHRDRIFSPPPHVMANLPPSVDLRSKCPPVYDQGQLGSCTANAIGAALDFERMRQNMPAYTPSRLFIYYGERVIEGSVKQDAGAMIRDGIKVVATIGAPPETDWPYKIAKFKNKPSRKSFKDALANKAIEYLSISTFDQMKSCLADGYPFIFGFSVYDSFESAFVAQTGEMPMPAQSERLLGGHAVLAVGYDDTTQRFMVRNSWGTNWGKSGYFTMPYAFISDTNQADDFWTIRLVSTK